VTLYISAAGEVVEQDLQAITETQLRDRLDDLFGVRS
jgi:hypothetical protein